MSTQRSLRATVSDQCGGYAVAVAWCVANSFSGIAFFAAWLVFLASLTAIIYTGAES